MSASPAPHDDGGVSAAVKAAAAAGSPSKPPPKPSSSSGGVLRRVAKTSFAYKTDLDTKDAQRCHPSGIVHATRASSSKEEHCFVWMDDVDDAISTKAMVDHLGASGYKPSGMKFVPFSTKENWTARYPHAVPHVECGAGGMLSGSVPVSEGGSKKRKRASKKGAKKAKPPPQFLQCGRLPDAERDELHRDIYRYLSWLHAEVAGMETTPVGRRKVQAAGVSVPALRGLLGKMEGTFRGLRPEGVPGGPQLGGVSVPGTALLAGPAANGALAVPPGLAEGGPDGMGALLDMDGVPVPVPQPQQLPPPQQPAPIPLPAELPYLERALDADLRRRVAHARPALSEGGGPSKPGRAKEAPWRREDFDALYDKLVAFRAAEGHASPPIKHPAVGKWVSELRLRKKTLRAQGMEWEEDDEEVMEVKADGEAADGAVAAGEGAANVEAATDGTTAPAPTPKPKANVRLTKSRVARLDAISFQWTLVNPRKTWEEHFADLRQFVLREGRPPTNKEGGLGNWLKTQRKLYSKRDADFLERRAARFDEIGVPLRTRHYSAQSWEDRFQQLVEFGRVNRHFNVPNPVPNGEDPPEINTEAAEAVRFYKFVKRLLNTKKRMDLFPTNLASKLIPTAMLASGFGMAAGTAFLLWRDMEIRSDMLSSDDGESRKGDWFLSLAAGSGDGSASAKFSSNTRARLCLHLSLFGLLNLGAHAGLYFSEGAPFLGMSAAIINVHNTLACVSALRKEEGTMEWMRQALTWPLRALQRDEKGGPLRVTTVLYGLSTASAWVGCILVGRSVLTSATGLLSGMAGAAEMTTLDNARQLSLQVASLARLTLEAGVSGTLYSASVAGDNKFLGHPFFAVLSGLLVSSCLAVGGSVLFDSFRSAGPVLNNIVGSVLVAFGALAGYHSVVALLAGRKKGAA